MNWISVLVIGGILIYPYLSTAMALMNVQFAYDSFKIKDITKEFVTLGIVVRANNPNNKPILFQQINTTLSLNGMVIGQINNQYHFYLNPLATAKFEIVIDIEQKRVGDKLWELIQLGNTNLFLHIKGTAKANNKSFPLDVTKTIDDFSLK